MCAALMGDGAKCSASLLTLIGDGTNFVTLMGGGGKCSASMLWEKSHCYVTRLAEGACMPTVCMCHR
jgi:hypothetical protein